MKEKISEVTIRIPNGLWIFLNKKAQEELRTIDRQIVWELMKDEDYKRISKNVKRIMERKMEREMEGIK